MFKTVVIAGTFDRLHKGHRHFISEAFNLSEKVVIGLTSDSYVQEKFRISNYKFRMNAKNFNDRKEELEEFLKDKNLLERAEIIKIDDVYGPTASQNNIEAIILTEETKKGGIEVNNKRRELGIAELKLIEVPLIPAEDALRISSTRIRLGEIDRWGHVFGNLKIYGNKIPEGLRNSLKQPLGKLIEGKPHETEEKIKLLIEQSYPVVLVTVGDEATLSLNRLKLTPDIAVVDFYIKRIKVHESLEDLNFPDQFYTSNYKNKITKTTNPPGFITQDLSHALRDAFKEFVEDGKPRVVNVAGEEDLAGVPAILLAPLGSLVFYGQPDRGIVAISVTEEKKNEIFELLEKPY